jgi:hypothetical protein
MKAYGSAQEFVWADSPDTYAVREGTSTVRIRGYPQRYFHCQRIQEVPEGL